MADLDLLLEAERRGLLPADKLALLNEARSRGLIGGGGIQSLKPPPKERTWGEAITDLLASTGSGIGKTMQVPGQLYGLITGDMETPQGPPQNAEEAKRALVRGAGNAAMPGMSGAQSLGKQLEEYSESKKSEVLKAKEAERNRLIQEAESKGLWEQAKAAGAATITDPALLASFLAEMAPNMIPIGAAARLGRGVVLGGQLAKGVGREAAELAAQKAGTRAALGTGAVMQGADVGTDTYEEAYRELIAREVPPEEAKQRALNLARASGLSAAAVSLLAQKLPGARRLEESFAGKAGVAGRAVGAVKTGLGEAYSEGFEEAGGAFGKNLAMRDINPEYDLTKGVGTAGALGAIGGVGLGGVAGALQRQEAPFKPEAPPIPEPTEPKAVEPLRLGYNPAVEDSVEKDPLQNPVGNLMPNELTPEIVRFVNNRRKEEGKPKLKAFSIEDLVESGAPPQEIDRLLAYKTQYAGDVKWSPEDVTNIAQQRNVDTETKGFTDFLRRATGQEDLAQMSQPQLHSAFKALEALEQSPELRVLPEGTNAVRFTDAQYAKGLKGVNFKLERTSAKEGETPTLGRTSVIQQIKDFTGLENDHDANVLLRTAIRNGDLESKRIPQYEVGKQEGDIFKLMYVSNSREAAKRGAAKLGDNYVVRDGFREDITFPGEITQLPGGPDVRMGTFKEGDQPEGYEIRAASDVNPTDVAKTEEEANRIAATYAEFREEEAKKLERKIAALSKKILDNQNEVGRLKATGMGRTNEVAQLEASIYAENQGYVDSVNELKKELNRLREPLTVVPTKSVTPLVREGFTYFENDTAVASFPTQELADQFALQRLNDETLTNIANIGPTLKGARPKRLAKMAEAELASRGKTEPGIEVAFTGTEEEARERLAKLGIFSADVQSKVAELEKALLPALRKLGLERVALNIVREIENNAEGNYAAGVIKISLDNEPGNYLGVLRHESIHALKELGAFTDKEWAVLNKQAREVWVPQYMKNRTTEYEGKQTSLYDAYADIYRKENGDLKGFDEYIQEEAIAEGFRYWKPQAGMFGNLGYRLSKMFDAIKNAFKGLGFQTSDSVFEKIEAGKMRPKQEAAIKEGQKFSLRTISSLNTAFNIAKGYNFERNKELKEVLQALVNFKADKEGIDLKTYSDETKEHLVEVGLADALRSLKSNASAVGWYDRKVKQALAIVSLVHPEIATDPDAKFAFTWALAVTSNGQKVEQNFELAEKAYRHYKRFGRMPTNIKAGQAQKAINQSLKLFNEMKKAYGPKLLSSFMATEFTASQIEKATGIKVTGEFKDTKVLGAAILGPKIGNGFFSNLNGIFDRLTMDRWLMRTWGRWTGTLVEINQPMIEKKREELKSDLAKLLKDKEASSEIGKLLKQELVPIENDEQADALAAAIQKVSMLPENRKVLNKTDAGESIRKSGNALFKYLDGQKEAPNGPAERDAIRDVFKDILKGLHGQGYQDMTMSDLQALLWYPEKRLYDIAKDSNIEEDYTTEEAPDYANAAAKLARSKKVSNAKIQAEIKKVDEDYDNRAAAAKRGVGNGPSAFDAQGRVAPLNRKEYKRFLTRGILQSYRKRNEKTPETYTRDSGRDGKGIRVLDVVAKSKYSPKTAFKNVMQDAGASVPAMYELQSQDADIFQNAIQTAKNKNVFGAAVTVYPESEYAKMRLFVAEDGKAGFALKGNDIVSVFSEAPYVGASASMLQLAVQEGGRKLDAFDTVLPDLYFNAGFKIVSRTEFNEEYQPNGWSKKTFNQFNEGKPDVVFMVYDPNNTEVPSPTAGRLYEDYDEAVKAQDEAVNDYKFPVKFNTEDKIYKPLEKQNAKEQAGPRYSLRPTEPSVRPSTGGGRGITLGERQEGAGTFSGIHYGKAKTERLNGGMFGSGIRGEESKRLAQSRDPRIKRRVYFYIPNEVGFVMRPEAGLGQHIYTQTFDNILPSGDEMTRLYRSVDKDFNAFESAVVDAGYDGYAVPSQGMMVILNHNVPVKYEGLAHELRAEGKLVNNKIKYSLRANPAQTETPEFKRWFGKSKIVTEYDTSPVSGNEIMDWLGIPEKAQSKYWQKLKDEQRNQLFKDYRGRNGSGQPKVMYHGTSRDITTFRPKQAGAIFVTDNPDFAHIFSGFSENYMTKEFNNKISNAEKKQILLEALEKVKKDLPQLTVKRILGSIENSQSLYTKNFFSETHFLNVPFGNKVVDEVRSRLESRQNIMPVYVRAENPFDYQNEEHVNRLVNAISKFSEEKQNELYDELGLEPIEKTRLLDFKNAIEDGVWEAIESPEVQKLIKKFKHDGFYIIEAKERNLAVYEPSQIKSAIGNIGTFDINNPDIRYSIRANLPAATNARIDATTGQRKTEGFMDRILSILNPETRAKLRAGFIFQFEALERGTKARAAKYGNREYMADVSATAAALESMRAKQIVAAAMRDGVPVYRNGFTTTDNLNGTQKGLLDIFSPLAATGDPDVWRCFQYYAGSKRGARLDAEGREHLFTPADVQAANAMAAQFKQDGIDFDSVYQEYQKWNKALVKYMQDTGVLSAADAAYFTKFGDYIPFYRQMDGEATVGPKIFSSIAGVQKPKVLKGGTEKLGDFLENVIRNASAAVESGMKNVAANRGIRDALDLGTARQVNVPNQDSVSIKENGVTKHYELDDPLLFEAFKGLNVPRMPWLQLLAKPADVLRNFVTKDPGFILANIMRDSVSAWVTSGSDMKPVIDSFKQFGKILANQSPEAVAMAKAGLGGYEFKGSLKDSADAFEKALRAKTGTRTKIEKALLPVTALWDMLEQGSNASDMATRAEIYKRTLAETGNEAEALFQASEVMNFSRRGNFQLMQMLTAVVPFMNARIQGLDVLYRSGFGQSANVNKERMQKAFIVRSLSILAMSAMYWAMVHDDDEYKKLTKEERDGYWIVPGLTFNGKPFRFPIPFEIGVVFKVFPERILELTYGQDTPKDFRESITRNIVDTLKFNPIPQAFIPIAENITNHSFFTGEKIVGRGLEDVAKPLQYNASTSLGARWLGEQTGQSPIQIDNVIRGYTGTMGMYAVNMLDAVFSSQGDPVKATTRAEQLPVIKRFFASDSGTVAQYYDLKDEVDEVVRTVNFLERNDPDKLEAYLKENENTYMLKDFVRSIDKDMKKIREYRGAVNADKDMSGDEKRTILDELHQYEVALTADIKAIRKEFH